MAGVLFVVYVPSSEFERKLCHTDTVSTSTTVTLLDEGVGAATSGHVIFVKTPTLLELDQHERCMQTFLEKTLEKLGIDNAVWKMAKGDNFFQVTFTVGAELCEEVLSMLEERCIGVTLGSSVSVLPCSVFYTDQACDDVCSAPGADTKASSASASASAWDKFVASVGARLTVAQVVEQVKTDAQLTFDFLVSLLMAGIVAALGLITDSTVVLVASMLISPLMGPIMAGTFGFVIEDRRLRKMGVRNELAGLSICLVVGFCIGLVVGVVDDFSGAGQLPTEEMLARGSTRSLWEGALIALPSGAALALALLGDNTSPLVGVAISASILPPAVNAGLLWALACIRLIWEKAVDPEGRPSREFVYSSDLSCELAVLGAVSLCLTLVNILCIFLMGILVLKIKEVAPRTSGKQCQFWRHDIKIARDYNKTVNKEEGQLLQAQLADEIAGLREAAPHISPERLLHMSSRLQPRHQQTWSPRASRDDSRMSLRQLEDLYRELTTRPAGRRGNSLMPESLVSSLGRYRGAGDAPKRRGTIAGAARPKERRRFLVSRVDEAS